MMCTASVEPREFWLMQRVGDGTWEPPEEAHHIKVNQEAESETASRGHITSKALPIVVDFSQLNPSFQRPLKIMPPPGDQCLKHEPMGGTSDSKHDADYT